MSRRELYSLGGRLTLVICEGSGRTNPMMDWEMRKRDRDALNMVMSGACGTDGYIVIDG